MPIPRATKIIVQEINKQRYQIVLPKDDFQCLNWIQCLVGEPYDKYKEALIQSISRRIIYCKIGIVNGINYRQRCYVNLRGFIVRLETYLQKHAACKRQAPDAPIYAWLNELAQTLKVEGLFALVSIFYWSRPVRIRKAIWEKNYIPYLCNMLGQQKMHEIRALVPS